MYKLTYAPLHKKKMKYFSGLSCVHDRFATSESCSHANGNKGLVPIALAVQQMMAKVKPEDCGQWEVYDYKGVPMFMDVLPSTLDDMTAFQVRDDDVFIVTYPKAGIQSIEQH